jgi:hypothetical protein
MRMSFALTHTLEEEGKEDKATYWVERRTAVATNIFLDLLVCDLQHHVVVGQSVSTTRADKLGVRWGGEGTNGAYSVGIRVPHVEKVFGIDRVCLGFKDVLGVVCAADTHGKSYTAYEDVHVVFRGKEAAGANVSVRQKSAGYDRTSGR